MRRTLAAALLLGVAVSAACVAAATGSAGVGERAGTDSVAPSSRPVVLAGIPGLLWTDISSRGTPALWRLAGDGSTGNLVVHAVTALSCPADGWLTLNGAARAMAPRPASGRCARLPAVTAGTPAVVPSMPSLVHYNQQFHYNPSWGLLARAAGPGGCTTAIGPGAALALAASDGRVAGYRPSVADASRADYTRCPLTVVDLGTVPDGPGQARAVALRTDDATIATIRGSLPPGATLIVAGVSDGVTARLRPLIVAGPGYRAGLLDSVSTRQPGLTQLTDLTPTLLHWRAVQVPSGVVGSPITRAPRGSLPGAIRGLIGQDTAAQVYASTSGWFLAAYGLADAVVFAAIGLLLWGPQPERRRRRAVWWRLAGTFAIAVPAASYLASVVSWWLLPHPASWLYGLTAAWTALIGAVALAGPWRRDPLAPLGLVAAVTTAVIAVDVATGSRLQMGTPFGLSAIGVVGGRFYGIGNNAIVIYAAAGIFTAAWLGMTMLRHGTRRPARAAPADSTGQPGTGQPGTGQPGRVAQSGSAGQPGRATRRLALLTAGIVALAAVAVSGWPGFGAKVGGTFAMVPCFLIVLMGLAGVRITARRAIAATLAGVALVVAFALVNYIVPATGQSDIGGFAGQVLHGGATGTLSRKINSNVGSLTVSYYALIVPPVVVLAGLILLRPSWFAVRTLPRAWAARPLLRVTLAAIWLVAVLSWFAEDSGVTVVAPALPFVLPLAIAACAAAAYLDLERPAAAAERSVRQAILDLPP